MKSEELKLTGRGGDVLQQVGLLSQSQVQEQEPKP